MTSAASLAVALKRAFVLPLKEMLALSVSGTMA